MGKILCRYYSKYHPKISVGISHESQTISEIQNYINGIHPELIIELGTFEGGMSLVLHEAYLDAEFHSYDIDFVTQYQINRQQQPPVRQAPDEWFSDNCHFHLEDVLTNNIGLKQLCADLRRKVLYCDNGNKPLEAQMYAPLLNTGDILGVHDWGIEIKSSDVEGFINSFKPTFEIGSYYKSKFWVKI